jgi:hypothetical protein
MTVAADEVALEPYVDLQSVGYGTPQCESVIFELFPEGHNQTCCEKN